MEGVMYESIVDLLCQSQNADDDSLKLLIDCESSDYLYQRAFEVRKRHYGTDVYMRGLIEFTNYCRNNCYYCGLRASNRNVERYRLTPDEIYA